MVWETLLVLSARTFVCTKPSSVYLTVTWDMNRLNSCPLAHVKYSQPVESEDMNSHKTKKTKLTCYMIVGLKSSIYQTPSHYFDLFWGSNFNMCVSVFTITIEHVISWSWKHRKNCECCPGSSQVISINPSIWITISLSALLLLAPMTYETIHPSHPNPHIALTKTSHELR